MLKAFEVSMDGNIGKIYIQGGEIDDDERMDAAELGRLMLTGYVEHYGKETEWEVIHSEQPFQINVPHPNKPGKFIVCYAGTWDVVMWNRVTKEFWLWDHKTRKAFLQNWSYLELDDQPGSYIWVAERVLRHKGILGEKDTVEGIVFNFLRKAPPDARPTNDAGEALNRDGTVSKRQPAARYHREEVYRSRHEVVSLAHRVQAEAQVMARMRKGTLPLYKTPAEDCARCKLFDYCVLDEQDPEAAAEYANATMMTRDPYADHREDMEAKEGVEL